MMLSFINETHEGVFDFFYLPIDFRNKCNVGYAFINFIHPIFIVSLYERMNAKKWPKFNSDKICQIAYGRIQGKKSLIEHFKTSNVMFKHDKKLKPILFDISLPTMKQIQTEKEKLITHIELNQKNGISEPNTVMMT